MTSSLVPKTHMRPEIALLLCCTRVCLDATRAETLSALLRTDLDWAYLLRASRQHGLIPVLYLGLRTAGSEGVPKSAMDQLQQLFVLNTGRNLRLTSELLNLLNRLDLHQIPAIPFKGPVLAASLHANPALRQAGDLDILVHEHDIPRARDMLISQGYEPYGAAARRLEAAHLRHLHAFMFVHPDHQIVVDLHWRLDQEDFTFPPDVAHIWNHLQSVFLMGKTVHTFSPDDLLLYLSMHGSKHFWPRLSWIYDVAKLLQNSPEIVSEELVARAQARGGERMLHLGLTLAKELLGTTIPETVGQQACKDPVIKALTTQISQRLFSPVPEELDAVDRLLMMLRMRERFRDKRRQVLHKVTLMKTHRVVPWKHLVRIPGRLVGQFR